MAKLNPNKLKIITDLLESAESGTISKKGVCDAAGLNPRYKSWQTYIDEVLKTKPELAGKIAGGVEAAPTTTPEEDDPELAKMLGDGEPECPEGKTGDDCCGDPENCSKKEATPKPVVDHKVVENAATLPPKTAPAPTPAPVAEEPDAEGIEYVLMNDKGLAEKLEVKAFNGKRMVFVAKADEVVNVTIQGQAVQVNLTKLEAQGKKAEADFYRTLAG